MHTTHGAAELIFSYVKYNAYEHATGDGQSPAFAALINATTWLTEARRNMKASARICTQRRSLESGRLVQQSRLTVLSHWSQ